MFGLRFPCPQSPEWPGDMPTVTPDSLIVTPSALDAFVDRLSGAAEVAVDLEHHSYRSFQGFTCLIQASSTWRGRARGSTREAFLFIQRRRSGYGGGRGPWLTNDVILCEMG